ncbi:MAG TPA: DUF3800 domain-containing protein [bacterium]|jgi:hypothetical protein|nr:MAG: hypothetical protein BWX59_02218 [Bacteroidetes bacterium ADurb.Bin028]HNU89767.1 DUF3800 domain-containing protein [bacterium]
MFNFLGKNNRELTLADYKNIWTPFCFIDESGTLDIKSQPYFTVGMIKCSQPYYLQQKIKYIRSKNRFWWELKFNNLNKVKINIALEVLDALFETRSIKFSSYTIDKRSRYFEKEFSGNPWIAYEQITKQLLIGNLGKNEVLIVLADDMTAPKIIKFEVNVKNNVNNKFKRLAIAGVCRLNSKTNDLLQLTDLLIGSINYELLLKEKIIDKPSLYKGKFIEKFKENLGVKTLTDSFRNYAFNIHYHYSDNRLK